MRSSTQIGTVSIDCTLIRITPTPPNAVPAITTSSYPATIVKTTPARTPIVAPAILSTRRWLRMSARSFAVTATEISRLPTAVKPASVMPATIPSTAPTVAYRPKSSTLR